MKRFLPLLLLPLAVGCGTMANMQGKEVAFIGYSHQYEPKPYGGMGNDLRWVGVQARGIATLEDPAAIPFQFIFMLYFGLVDLPLSFCGDTVTLYRVLNPKPKPTKSEEEKQAAADSEKATRPPTSPK